MAFPSFFPSALVLHPPWSLTHHTHMHSHIHTLTRLCDYRPGLWELSEREALRCPSNLWQLESFNIPVYIFAIIWVLTSSLEKVSCYQVPLCLWLFSIFSFCSPPPSKKEMCSLQPQTLGREPTAPTVWSLSWADSGAWHLLPLPGLCDFFLFLFPSSLLLFSFISPFPPPICA